MSELYRFELRENPGKKVFTMTLQSKLALGIELELT